MNTLWAQIRHLNPYDIHKLLINEYVLKRPGDTTLLKRDTSRDRNDSDVIRENHKFLWNESDKADSWELQFAKKYYDKLFKEYCIGDLSLYKENKIALRWRTEKEVVFGKGQFICGNKRCSVEGDLRSWEVNFAYREDSIKKNALVKIRLCPNCSKKLNYHSKKREIKRLQKSLKKTYKRKKQNGEDASCSNSSDVIYKTSEEERESFTEPEDTERHQSDESPWEQHGPVETKSREEEMEDYLNDLLL